MNLVELPRFLTTFFVSKQEGMHRHNWRIRWNGKNKRLQGQNWLITVLLTDESDTCTWIYIWYTLELLWVCKTNWKAIFLISYFLVLTDKEGKGSYTIITPHKYNNDSNKSLLSKERYTDFGMGYNQISVNINSLKAMPKYRESLWPELR